LSDAAELLSLAPSEKYSLETTFERRSDGDDVTESVNCCTSA